MDLSSEVGYVARQPPNKPPYAAYNSRVTQRRTSKANTDAGTSRTNECWRYGKVGHIRKDCRAIQCFECKHFGHKRAQCPLLNEREKTERRRFSRHNYLPVRASRSSKQVRPSTVRYTTDTEVEYDAHRRPTASGKDDYETEERETDTVHTIYAVSSEVSQTGIEVKINGRTVTMQPDSGSFYSLLPSTEWIAAGRPKLSPGPTLRGYTGHAIPTLGKAKVKVEVLDRAEHCEVVFTENDKAVPLFGRSWFETFGIMCGVHTLTDDANEFTSRVQKLADEYADVFRPDLGLISVFQAHLHIRTDAQFKLHKPRMVPFALRPAVERALDKLVTDGVAYHADTAE